MADRRPAAVAIALAGALGLAMLVAALVPLDLIVDPRLSVELLTSAVGAVALVCLYALAPPVYAAGVGLAIVAVLVAPATPAEVVVAVAGAALVLVRDARTAQRPIVAVIALLSSAAVTLATAALATVTLGVLWQAALALCVVGATLIYGVHRYERVRMGLVSDT